jgi:p-cumate 2,3-dioxygenase subunit beta
MTLTRREAEDFLFLEAELLDDWLMEEWAALYSEEAVYEVASPSCEDPVNADPANTLFLVADRIGRIRGRAKRLLKPTAHAEFPRSKTRHMISNIRVVESSEDRIRTRANFAVFRTKEDTSTIYMGEVHHTIVREGGSLRILNKRCILDLNSLYNQGRLTIIL